MRMHFLGAAQTVTGSSYLVETRRHRILIDAGLPQGSSRPERQLQALPVHPRHLDAVILTHAHADHSGLIPRLVADGFRGPIYATPPTIDLCRIILPDSGTIQEEEARSENRWRRRRGKDLIQPLFTKQQAELSLRYFERLPYRKVIPLGRDVRLSFHDAGHILGSAVVDLEIEGSRLIISGDLGNNNSPLLRPKAIIDHADYLVIESTYGDRFHKNKGSRLEQLAEVIRNARGPIIIPAFAVERTQEMLFDLHQLIVSGRIPRMPIYLDSPMGVQATGVFSKHAHQLTDAAYRLFSQQGAMDWLQIIGDARQSQELNRRTEPMIILSSGGMCEGGRIRHHLYHHLPHEEATVLFVGFQAEGTLGRRLRDGASEVVIHGDKIPVKAAIASIEAYSAHADRQGLLDWVGAMGLPPALTFVTHGEPRASESLAQALATEHGLAAVVPGIGDSFELLPASSRTARLVPKGA